MSHINRRKFIKITSSAVAVAPLVAAGIPTVGAEEITTSSLVSLTKDLKVGYEGDGGYYVPQEIADMIAQKLNDNSPIREAAKSIKDK